MNIENNNLYCIVGNYLFKPLNDEINKLIIKKENEYIIDNKDNLIIDDIIKYKIDCVKINKIEEEENNENIYIIMASLICKGEYLNNEIKKISEIIKDDLLNEERKKIDENKDGIMGSMGVNDIKIIKYYIANNMLNILKDELNKITTYEFKYESNIKIVDKEEEGILNKFKEDENEFEYYKGRIFEYK